MLSRRQFLPSYGALALSATTSVAGSTPSLPDKSNFRVQEFETCLNNARWHPLSNGARAAATAYQEYKQRGMWDRSSIWSPTNPDSHSGSLPETKRLFASLIHASPDDIAFVQSTTAGENLVVQALGLASGKPGNIVTDGLHFEGSLYLYDSLRKQGVDVRVVKPQGWGIDVKDVDKAITGQTKLVAVSLVSYINGFQHDLKSLCDIAHSRGALVYADIIQAVGAMPLDVTASGVDFCATASYKWLMGDFGLGFLYARPSVRKERLTRPVYSYRQLHSFTYHQFPGDPPSEHPWEWEQEDTAAGYFEQGTLASAVSETLRYSLGYIQTIGVEAIHRHSRDLTDRLRKELPARGYPLITSDDSHGPIVAFSIHNPDDVQKRLAKAKVDVTISGRRMRISPSVYNDHRDLDKLMEALG
jgi:selenocysteine lyase/cysteine desulfurase